jgi:ATP phosphoribosyltransferase
MTLVLAVPSKGRLQENTAAFFARAGLVFRQKSGVRDYRATIEGIDGVDVAFLSASEIAGQLANGQAHLGVTGEDLLHETLPLPDKKVLPLCPLGFGHANVVVAVPRAWIDVRTMRDLDEVAADLKARKGRRMRVATKYLNLTRRFFEKHGLSDYTLLESPGATEGAPAAGNAEIIVDITTTGATLDANALKILEDGTILRSQAHLVAARSALWREDSRQVAKRVLSRIAAEEAARTTRDLSVITAHLPEALNVAASWKALRLESAPSRLLLRCAASDALGLGEALIGAGAMDVSIQKHEALFTPDNPLEQVLNLI